MPRLSRWFIRAALVHLILGFTVGALLLSHKGVFVHGGLWRLRTTHIELLLFGWTIQMGLGVSFWILPRFWEEKGRGDTGAAWLAFWLLNGGVLAVIVGSILALTPFVLIGRAAEVVAAAAYTSYIWRRVAPRGG